MTKTLSPTIVKTHWSGLWASKHSDYLRDLRELYKQRHFDVLTVTEAGTSAHAHALADFAAEAGFTCLHHANDEQGRDEGAVLVRAARFGVIYFESEPITDMVALRETGHPFPLTCMASAVVEDHLDGNRRWLFTSLHTPHGIESKRRELEHNTHGTIDESGAEREVVPAPKAYVAVIRGAVARAAVLRKKYKVSCTVISGDWNLSLTKAWVRALFRVLARGYRLTWSLVKPEHGTHAGGRPIDGSLLGGNVVLVGAHVGHKRRSSDHIEETETIRARA